MSRERDRHLHLKHGVGQGDIGSDKQRQTEAKTERVRAEARIAAR